MVNKYEFVKMFEDSLCFNVFTRSALYALYDFFTEMEDDNFEVDVIAICCDFVEYETVEEAYLQYNEDKTLSEEEMLEWLSEQTEVIEFNGVIIIGGF